MPARLLLEIALRVLGIKYLFDAVCYIAAYGSLIAGYWGAPAIDYFFSQGVFIAAHLLIGGFLLARAPRISVRFFPASGEEQQVTLAVGPGDVYRIACVILGAYLSVMGFGQVGTIAAPVMQGGELPLAMLFSSAVYIGSGVLLIFGAQIISETIASFRYDPDAIPRPRFTLTMMLALLLGAALLLGLLRASM